MEKMEQSIREEREDFLREKQITCFTENASHFLQAELAIRIAMTRLKEEVYPSEKKKPSTKEKAADSVPPKTPDDPKQPSTFLKSRRTPPAAAAQPVLPRTTSNGFDIGPLKREICPFCDSDNIFNDPVAAIQHIVGHGASIADLEFIFFEDDKFIAAEPQVSGEKCNVCDISFAFATLFYIHLLTTHRSALALFYQPLYPNANNVKILTELVYRKFPEHTIQFREIIPKLAMRD
ncbi:unnamed protein product [Heligmosomoides polygyrus]|uniref:C2H2-type domain-containing protein n=1 Tax=Heligmosomoides polygyrus TaxID=6339 RepID=A0A183F771_HELPZ|nr:unnamed protein product [Heligmosomoides polygyrus]